MSAPALSPVLQAIADHSPYYAIVKEQAPDGLIVRIGGQCFAVNAHPCECYDPS